MVGPAVGGVKAVRYAMQGRSARRTMAREVPMRVDRLTCLLALIGLAACGQPRARAPIAIDIRCDVDMDCLRDPECVKSCERYKRHLAIEAAQRRADREREDSQASPAVIVSTSSPEAASGPAAATHVGQPSTAMFCRKRPLSPEVQAEREKAIAWVKEHCKESWDAGRKTECSRVDSSTCECKQFRGFTRAPSYNCPADTPGDWVSWANESAGPHAVARLLHPENDPNWEGPAPWRRAHSPVISPSCSE
jgi:hypothetical protein